MPWAFQNVECARDAGNKIDGSVKTRSPAGLDPRRRHWPMAMPVSVEEARKAIATPLGPIKPNAGSGRAVLEMTLAPAKAMFMPSRRATATGTTAHGKAKPKRPVCPWRERYTYTQYGVNGSVELDQEKSEAAETPEPCPRTDGNGTAGIGE